MLYFSPTTFEFSQALDKASKPLNASLNQMEPQPQVQRRRRATYVTNQPSQTPFLLCSVQFPRAIASAVMNAEMERTQYRT